MRELGLKVVVFLLPFVVYSIVCYIVDPFCYFNNCQDEEKKERIAKRLNAPLWKVLSEQNNIQPNVYLGSSKIALFNVNTLEKLTKKEFTNLTFGAATVEEQINLFWMISNNKNLKNIYFEVDLLCFNKNNSRDRVTGVKGMLKNPILYIFNYNVFEGLLENLKETLKPVAEDQESEVSSKTQDEKEKFWKEQMNEALSRYLEIYEYPESYEQRFKEIKEEADKKGIELHFVFCPIHEDIPNVAFGEKYNLLPEKEKIIGLLSKLGRVYDADQYNWITKDKDNFTDPFHINTRVLNKHYSQRIFSDTDAPVSDSLIVIYQN